MGLYDYLGNAVKAKPTKAVPWISDMHRGYTSDTVPQNTLAAFYRAFLNDADCIEVDARLTSDSQYVCVHDATITVDGTTYTVANETADTLTALVLSTDATYGDCTIPLLEDVLKLCCYTGMYCNLDCKSINPTTLSQLVVDCGMSGRTFYANTSTGNAATILTVDPNAGFMFAYSSANVATWAGALTDYYTRQRSYAWASSISYAALEETRAAGFKYLLSEVNSTANMAFIPDCIEFQDAVDCKALNDEYMASLSLV